MELDIHPLLVTLLSVFVTAWIGIRLYEAREKYQADKKCYDKLSDEIWPFLHSILSEGSGLNATLISDFPRQKNAAREYVDRLGRSKKKRFLKIWIQYEAEYQLIKPLGAFACAVAIAPPDVDISDKSCLLEMVHWESERVERIRRLLYELLNIAKVRRWF